MLVIPCEHCWCSGIMQDSHSCDPGSIPGQCNTFSRVPLLQMMWMTIYVGGIMQVIPCEHCWCSGIMQDSHSCDPGSIPGQFNTFSRVPLLQMMWMTMYMLVVLCWWYLVSTAGVVVSCKIPILATRVRFPGSATLLVGFLYSKWCEWQCICWWCYAGDTLWALLV